MSRDGVGLGVKILAQQVTCHPVVVLAENLVINVFEQFELNRFAGPLGWLDAVGALLFVFGFLFEAIGDAQLSSFKADPKHKGEVMERGLWRYTRHPNYFGDACLWTGVYLVAAEHWPGMLTIVSPVLMTSLLAFGTGKRLLEQSMAKRPGYAEYMRRTSGFIPLPRKFLRN
jgi:steroid 5-alpha reductase family enzyme